MAHCQNHQDTTIDLKCTQCKNWEGSQFPNAQTKAKAPRKRKDPNPSSQNFPMEQQPATLIPKATATATHVILPVMSTPSRGPTPWPNTVLASANLFTARSWPLPPNKGDSPIPAMQKVIVSDPSKTESTPRKTTIPHPVSLIPENFATTSGLATANILATSKYQEKRWGPSCQCCAHPTSHPEQADFDWSEEDWDEEIQKAKQKEKQRIAKELKQNLTAEEHGAATAYYPPGLLYKSAYEQDPPALRNLPT